MTPSRLFLVSVIFGLSCSQPRELLAKFNFGTARFADLVARNDWGRDAVALTQSLMRWQSPQNFSGGSDFAHYSSKHWERVIHMTVKDKGNGPIHLQGCLEMNPGWKPRVVDDSEMLQDVRNYAPRLLPMFEVFSIIERTDAWRYLIVFWKGGVYLDSDVRCVTPFENWIESWMPQNSHSHALLGIEVVGSTSEQQWHPVQFCQWAFACRTPQHPFFAFVIDHVIAQFLITQRWTHGSDLSDVEILQSTGPHIWSQAVIAWANNTQAAVLLNEWDWTVPTDFGGVAILGRQAFGAGFPTGYITNGEATHVQLVGHTWKGSWKTD